jgi:Flp pilus assembly protein TadD
MRFPSHKFKKLILISLFIFSAFFISSSVSAQEENLTVLQKQARDYRNKGLALQRVGNIDEAMGFYQKAVEVDPSYAVVYNDLGVIFEAKGMPERAEKTYLTALSIDPSCLNTYSNLAMFYESKRDLDKAGYYWRKRAELGAPGDYWTEKARQRAGDITVVSSNKPAQAMKELEAIDLIKGIAAQKAVVKNDEQGVASMHFTKAKQSFNKKDYATAVKEALDAQQLDPTNEEIEKFIEKVQLRALSK